jgi:diguanylate cyclase (GGDEF)-like protein
MRSTRIAWQRAVLALFHLRSKVAVYVCGGLFLLIAIADILTPPELNLSLFYVFVILLATWNAGFASGAVFALAAGFMQWEVLSMLPGPHLHSVYWYVWLANRWVTFVVVVALTHPLRILFDRHRAAARIDALTEAANQKYFRELLQVEITRSARSGEPLAVAFMDCDDFKLVNDQFGHAVGDSVLRTVVETARGCTRRTDTVARLGGDEFGILLSGATSEQAGEALNRLRTKIQAHRVGGQWPITLSIGLATFDRTALDPEAVIALCDSLMYRAKRTGRGHMLHEHFAASGDQLATLAVGPVGVDLNHKAG